MATSPGRAQSSQCGQPRVDRGCPPRSWRFWSEPEGFGILASREGGPVKDVRVQHNLPALLLKLARKMFPSLARAIADGGYQGKATAQDVRAEAKIPFEIVKRPDTAKGFVLLPKSWIVERTFGWLGRCRRLATSVSIRKSHPVTRRLRSKPATSPTPGTRHPGPQR